MTFRTLLASSAAFAAIAVVIPAASPISFNFVSAAQAQDVSISFGVFYDDLAPHGSWTRYEDDYVFVPRARRAGWRPYTEGHWIYASGYGWTWVSDEPFGWATYHYGRWGYDDDFGWYWVPGKRWAPAWVSWRRSGTHVVWAPLPHTHDYDYDDDMSISFSVNSIPDNYWVAVPTQSFLEVNLNLVIIDNDRDRRRIVSGTEFVGSSRFENNVVVNNVIEVNFIEEKTGKRVKQVEVKETNNPTEAKASDGEVAVFKGSVETEVDKKPAEVKPVEEIKKEQAAAPAQDDSEPSAAASGDVKVKDDAKVEGEANVEGVGEAEATDPVIKKKREKKPAAEMEQQPDAEAGKTATAPDAEVVAPAQKPERKKARKGKAEPEAGDDQTEQAEQAEQDEQAEQAEQAGGDDAVEPSPKKQSRRERKQAKEQVEQGGDNAEAQQPAEEKDAPVEDGQKKADCDPATNLDCN